MAERWDTCSGLEPTEKAWPTPTAHRPWGSRTGAQLDAEPRIPARPARPEASSSCCLGHRPARKRPAHAQKGAAAKRLRSRFCARALRTRRLVVDCCAIDAWGRQARRALCICGSQAS